MNKNQLSYKRWSLLYFCYIFSSVRTLQCLQCFSRQWEKNDVLAPQLAGWWGPKKSSATPLQIGQKENKTVEQELRNNTWIRTLRNKITTTTHVENLRNLSPFEHVRSKYICSQILRIKLGGNGHPTANTPRSLPILPNSLGHIDTPSSFGARMLRINESFLHGY